MARPVLAVGRLVRQRHVVNALRKLPRPGRVLDAGCGEGRVLAAMAGLWPQAKIVGIDGDDAVLRTAREVVAHHPEVDVRTGLVGGPPLGEKFDVVVCVDVMEHIPDDARAFRWLAEHCAPGGSLVLHVPASPQKHLLKKVERRLAEEVDAGQGPHFRLGYDVERCRALLEAAGFTPRSMSFTFHVLPVRLAEDVDTTIHHIKPLKAALLPALLLATVFERRPERSSPGYGLLVVADAPS